ncbi:MAG: HD domain-containing protein [Lachnospiraceae bacterium]|nr:HD domain-containing protein [Lachnospiraceae bacterium]
MKSNRKITFDITKSLFSILEYDRPEISLSGIHVLLLTECFYRQLPFAYRIKINHKQLRYGALLHDIGKIGIPKEILNKPGKLEKEEMELVKNHAKISAEILGSIYGLEALASWIQYHHERFDGKGYYHLKGKEIPLEAQMIAITDTYSAIIMESSYKPARTHEDAISVLKLAAGTQFNHELIRIFCQIPSVRLDAATEEAAKLMEKAGIFFSDGFA